MNISVERKIASIAEKLEGVTYLFDNWVTANVRLDKMAIAGHYKSASCIWEVRHIKDSVKRLPKLHDCFCRQDGV